MVKNENQFKVEQLIMKEKEIKELKKRLQHPIVPYTIYRIYGFC